MTRQCGEYKAVKRRQLNDEISQQNFTVNVRQECIDEGVRGDSSGCMVEEALRRIRGVTSVNVDAALIRFNFEHHRYFFPTPAKAAVNIIAFDDGKPVRPFKFRLQHGMCAPVNYRGPRATPKAKHRTHAKRGTGVRRKIRRFHGVRVIEVTPPDKPVDKELW